MEIQGFPQYLIYKDGRVQNKKTGKILKGGINNGGYKHHTLRNNGFQITLTKHRLVAIHYIPNPNNYNVVDHIDRNKKNNNVDNLRWVTNITNGHNTGKYITNKSGHKNISFIKDKNSWIYNHRVNGRILFRRQFKSKVDCICYKFYCLLSYNLNN